MDDEEASKEYSMRFMREAQSVARLNHPHIVQVYDFGEQGEIAYIVMEFIKGKELKNFFDANERFELKEAVRIMCELLDALDLAHENGIVHRDIKPANVMLDGQARVKLADFGVARVTDDRSAAEKTQAGTMVGTPAYMSPEQITGGNVDRRTDIFSAGIILYQFLTGEKPFTGSGAWTIAKKIIQDHPPVPSSINNTISPLFDNVVNKALSKQVETRYQTAKEFGAALKRALEGRSEEDDSDKTVVGSMADMGAMPRLTPQAAVVRPESTKSTSATGSQEVELEFWRAIKDGNDPDDFELYVQQFPTGIYAALAKRKIAKLRGVTPEETSSKVKEQEKREAEDAAKREAEVKQKLADEKVKLEAQLAQKEAEYAKREAEAEARRVAAEKARAEADAKREAEAQARAANEEKARLEAIEKAKKEAAATLAAKEAEYQKREAEARAKAEAEAKARREIEEKAKKDAEIRAKAEAETRAHEAKARAEAEVRAKKEAEERARRDAEAAKARSGPEEEAGRGAQGEDARGADHLGDRGDRADRRRRYYYLTAAQREKQAAPDRGAGNGDQGVRGTQGGAVQAAGRAEGDRKGARGRGSGAQVGRYGGAEEGAGRGAPCGRGSEEAGGQRQGAGREGHQGPRGTEKSQDAARQSKAEPGEAGTRSREGGAQAEPVAKAEPKAEPVAKAEPKAAPRVEAKAEPEPKAAPKSGGRAERERLADEEAARKALAAAGRAPSKDQQTVVASAAPTSVASAPSSSAAPTAAAPAAKPGGSELDTLYQQALAMESGGNAKDAIRIYRRAARAGSGKAAKRLGEIFDKGAPGVSRDYAESLQWYETARQLGETVETAGKR
jgi:hypothetical protein